MEEASTDDLIMHSLRALAGTVGGDGELNQENASIGYISTTGGEGLVQVSESLGDKLQGGGTAHPTNMFLFSIRAHLPCWRVSNSRRTWKDWKGKGVGRRLAGKGRARMTTIRMMMLCKNKI